MNGNPPQNPGPAPTIDAIHRDVALANQYRIELIKLLLTIAAALLAFTIAFRPSLRQVDCAWAMWLGWAGLALSMFGGMVHMLGWDHFYKSYRDFDWKGGNAATPADRKAAKDLGKAERKKINRWRRAGMGVQFLGFVIGVAGVAVFAGVNIDNGAKPAEQQQGANPHGAAAAAPAAFTAPAAPAAAAPPAVPAVPAATPTTREAGQ